MRLYFAGSETAHDYKYRSFKPTDDLFCTYFYKKKTENFLNYMDKKHEGIVTIDSGAHSFFAFIGLSVSSHKSKNEMPDPEVYFAKYLAWIKEWYDFADFFVELDLQDIVGQPKVLEWRQKYKDAGVWDKIITVHHSMNSWQDYEDLIADSDSKYIALEGLRGGKENIPYLKLIKYAYQNKVKVHGFALTNQNIICKYPFYSVDSSSWTAVNRYGITFKFDEGKGRMNQFAPSKKTFLKFHIPIEMHNTLVEAENRLKKLEFAQLQFRAMGEFYDRFWKVRGVDWEKQLTTKKKK